MLTTINNSLKSTLAVEYEEIPNVKLLDHLQPLLIILHLLRQKLIECLRAT